MVGRPVQHATVTALTPLSQHLSFRVCSLPLIHPQCRGNLAFPSSSLTSWSPCPACPLGALDVLKPWCGPGSLPQWWIQHLTLPLLLQMIPITHKYCIVMQKFCKERIKIQWCLNCFLYPIGILHTGEELQFDWSEAYYWKEYIESLIYPQYYI